MPLFDSPPTALCILRLSAIGDCCNAVAMAQAIQRQWPSTALTWIMGKAEAALLDDLPGIEVIAFDKRAGFRGHRDVQRQLGKRRFDALLHMQSALRASSLSLSVQATHRLGFDRKRAGDGQGFFTNHKVASPDSPHVLDGFMAFAGALGVKDLTPRWDLPSSIADQQWAAQLLAKRKTLLLCPAASLPYKNWTTEGYAALVDHASDWGFQVALCTSPADGEVRLAKEIAELCAEAPLNLAGQTSLKQLLALIERASLVLAPDSGPAHMATATGTPVIGLYAHHNPARTGPYHCRDYAVSVYEECLRAERGKGPEALPWRTRVKDPDAMSKIPVEAVLKAFDRLIQDRNLA